MNNIITVYATKNNAHLIIKFTSPRYATDSFEPRTETNSIMGETHTVKQKKKTRNETILHFAD